MLGVSGRVRVNTLVEQTCSGFAMVETEALRSTRADDNNSCVETLNKLAVREDVADMFQRSDTTTVLLLGHKEVSSRAAQGLTRFNPAIDAMGCQVSQKCI